MTYIKRKISTRLIRKGALTDDTYRAFHAWNLSLSFRDNLNEIRKGNLIGAKNDGWLNEIVVTLSSRFKGFEDVEPLVILAKGDLDIEIWKSCLLWHIGNIDEIFYRFCIDWLFNQYIEGAYYLRSTDVLPLVRNVTNGRISSGDKLSEYGALRAARDLLRLSTEFGILEGTVKKKFANFHLPQEAFMYVLHGLHDQAQNALKVVTSESWRLFLMGPEDVERELLRLHQFNYLEYQVAGSLMELKLPCDSLTQYARKLVA